MNFPNIPNLDLYSVGLAAAASLYLGFAVYFNNRKSITNQLFLIFTFISCVWGIFNYFLYQLTDPGIVLFTIRTVMFLAIWQAFSFFLLANIFPNEEHIFKRNVKILFVLVVINSIIAYSPYLFTSVITDSNSVPKAIPGPGMISFALTAVGSVIAGLTELFVKRKKALGLAKKQINSFLTGVGIMFSLIVIFNFVLPVFFDNRSFIPLGSVFVLPFVVFTGYSIMKHKLLNAKVITTEIFSFLLVILIFVEVVLSKSGPEIIFRSALFILLIFMSLLLIKSVRQEVQQREMLQQLSDELANANDKLTVLDKARAEFISIASHQLRTPPATIKWYLAAILHGDYGTFTPKIQKALERAQITNNDLISLIDDMLNASRIERGKMEFLFEETDVVTLAENVVMQLIPQALQKNLKLVWKKPSQKFPTLLADKEKLSQVFNNLIDNAIKYSKVGDIKIELTKTNSELIFKVKDNGKGVAKQDLKTIFEKYGRGTDSKKQASGLGLGLYVAKIVVEHHKGKIWAESLGLGKGTTFVVSLPIKTDLKAEIFDLTQNQTQSKKT
jgi:signal transduction histidine kinase